MTKPKKVRIHHEDIVRRFAESLRETRRSRGMTQAELARQAHLTETYISRLESASVAPGIDLVARLATALGCSVTDLLPSSPMSDTSIVLREQAKRLFGTILDSNDRNSVTLLNQFMALLAEAVSKHR